MTEVVASTSLTCRKAVAADIDSLHFIIEGYARQGIMLPRSQEMLAEQINSFVVAEDDGVLIGCGSLMRLGPDLIEIRSIGVTDTYKGRGVGKMLVDSLLEQARLLGVPKVMALTYEVGFFLRNGFSIVPKEVFPEKVWRDCMNCKKQYCCDEIAVLRRID